MINITPYTSFLKAKVTAYLPVFLMVVSVAFSTPSFSQGKVEHIRIWRSPEKTRVVLDLNKPMSHKVFTLKNPNRLVIDLPKSNIATDLKKLPLSNTPVKLVRAGKRNNGGLRIVMDLKKQVRTSSFILPPNESYGNRLVVDIFEKSKKTAVSTQIKKDNRDIIIAIDAGHGGEDPGALGPKREYEKTVVLEIAKQLKKQIDVFSGYKAVLVRTGDYYIPLRKRSSIARKHHADIFLSIHADSFRLPTVQGASVYALSTKGATSETASYLAQRENRADFIGGANTLDLKNRDDQLASVLIDLSMSATLDSSLQLGELILEEMKSVTKLHKRTVEQANFAVLRSPDIPSLLIETGYISSPIDSKMLKNKKFQKTLSTKIAKGVYRYFKRYPPRSTKPVVISLDPFKKNIIHVVKAGDSLSKIAQKHGVDVKALMAKNSLKSALIRINQKLLIPEDS